MTKGPKVATDSFVVVKTMLQWHVWTLIEMFVEQWSVEWMIWVWIEWLFVWSLFSQIFEDRNEAQSMCKNYTTLCKRQCFFCLLVLAVRVDINLSWKHSCFKSFNLEWKNRWPAIRIDFEFSLPFDSHLPLRVRHQLRHVPFFTWTHRDADTNINNALLLVLLLEQPRTQITNKTTN